MPLNDVPTPGQTLASSQNLIRTNFTTIDAAFAIDHAAYNAVGQGKHAKITFPTQAVPPAFLAGETGLFNMVLAGINETYIRKYTNGGPVNIPFTSSILSNSLPLGASAGWTRLPSGITLIWGYAQTNGLTVINMAHPAPSQLLYVMVSPFTPADTGYVNLTLRVVNIVNNSTFRVYGSVNGVAGIVPFAFLAIGY